MGAIPGKGVLQFRGRTMPQFVLLEHEWGAVHWDFMLEDGDSLRTWALDVPIVSGIDQPARELADHRRAYLDYEGEVSGGRGTVRRLDKGRYEVRVCTPELIRVRLEGDQLVGEVELRKAGSRSGLMGTAPSSSWTFRLGNLD